MGINASVSENIASEIIRTQTNILNTTTQQCLSNSYQIENITFKGKGITNVYGNINQNEVYFLNMDCVADVVNSSAVTNQISQAAAQTAKSVAQNLSAFTIAEADATNIVNDYINVGVNVISQTYQGCIGTAYQSENIVFQGSGTVNIYGTINQTETANNTFNCVLNATNKANVVNNASQTIDQLASAIVQNSFALIALAVILIVVVFFLFDFGVAESLLNWKTLLVIGAFIIVFILLAYWLKIWPFHRHSTTTSSSSNTTPPTTK